MPNYAILILVVLVLAAIIVFSLYLKKRHAERITQLHGLKDEIFNDPIEDKFFNTDQLTFSGDSKIEYDTLINDWERVQRQAFTATENKIYAADRLAQDWKFPKATQLENEAEEDMADLQVELAQIKQGMQDFLESAEENKLRITTMEEDYEDLKDELSAHSFSYGSAGDLLENQLKLMEEDFASFSTATEEGDHVKAKNYLEKLESKIEIMNNYMTRVPDILGRVNNTYRDELEQLNEGYQSLKSSNIAFPNDTILADIEYGYEQIKVIKEMVGQLQLDSAEEQMKALETLIDEQYEKMETEYQAQIQVKQQFSQLRAIFKNLFERNHQIKIETDRISQSYFLNDETLSYGSKKEFEIEELQHHFENVQSKATSQESVYSDVENYLDGIFEEARNIYDNQDEFLDGLYGLREEELVIKEEVNEFGYRMSELKQRVDRSNLPGIDDYYAELYTYVTNRLQDLAGELSAIRLNMDNVRYLYDICQKEIPNLEQQAADMIRYARLTEQMIQPLNRYKNEYEGINDVIEMIDYYYNHEYNYASAYRLASEQLNKIAPEEYESIHAGILRK